MNALFLPVGFASCVLFIPVAFCGCVHCLYLLLSKLPHWPSGKASASRVEDPGFESYLRRDFVRVESYQ